MKKLIIILTSMLISFSMFAQTSGDNLTYKGGKFYYNGQKIEKAELADFFGNQYVDVSKALSKRKAGLWELGCGTAAIAAGMAWTVHSSDMVNDPNQENNITGLIVGPSLAVAGAICDVIGAINVVTGPAKAKKIAKDYSKKYTADFSFGSTPNGIGLALNF